MKKIILTSLLAILPMVVMADANVTKSPFSNDPILKEFQKLQSDMNRIFENFNREFFNDMKLPIPSNFDSGFSFSIKTDVVDKGDFYEIKADLPGVDESAIKVEVKDNILSIQAKSQKSKEEKKGDRVVRKERFVGSFYRAMRLPNDADSSKMKTNYKNGVLVVTIPKSKRA